MMAELVVVKNTYVCVRGSCHSRWPRLAFHLLRATLVDGVIFGLQRGILHTIAHAHITRYLGGVR
jgi:hypothetical protein